MTADQCRWAGEIERATAIRGLDFPSGKEHDTTAASVSTPEYQLIVDSPRLTV